MNGHSNGYYWLEGSDGQINLLDYLGDNLD